MVGNDMGDRIRGHGEGHQGGGHVQILERAGHGVLTANGGDTQVLLGLKRAQQSRQGLAPALAVVTGRFKILLEGQIHIPEGGAGGHQLGGGLHHGQVCPVVGALFRNEGVVAPGHQRAIVGVAPFRGDLLNHGLDRGLLIFAAEGHEHGPGADGGVEPLGQASAGAQIEIGD